MASERNTSSNAAVNLLSRSWIKNRIGSARSTNVSMMLRACWVAHSPVGFAVMPARYTCRVASSMNTSACSRRNSTVSTVKKSQATIPLAWARRNSRHVSDDRRGAGSIPDCCRINHTVLAAIRTPSPASSPWIRR
jgi:beta-glucanase (GH16 family)